MENNKTRSPEEVKAFIFKILPFIAIGLLFIGVLLEFLLPFYEMKMVQGENTVKVTIQLHQILSGEYGTASTQIVYWITYIALPAVALGLTLLAKKFKSVAMIAILVLLLCGSVSIVSKDVLSEIMDGAGWVNHALIGSIIPAIVFFISAAFVLIAQNGEESFTVSDITEAGMLVALAFVLNFFPLFKMPTGGSVNLQIFPLVLFALRRGPIKGFIVSGIVYGLITCLTDGYGLATFPFDYLIGFGSCGLAGFFSPFIFGKDQKGYNFKGEIFLFVAVLLATSVRFVGSTISSLLFYGLTFAEAAIYNLGYVFISGAIAAAIIMALYAPLVRVNALFPVKKKAAEAPAKVDEESSPEENPTSDSND